MKKVVFLLVFCIAALAVKAQSNQPANPNSQQPSLPTKVYAPKVSKKKKGKAVTYDARDQFYDRMEGLGKAKAKNEKKMLKPEYSKIQYFGHKKPPKKRPPEKMKYCKICGLRH